MPLHSISIIKRPYRPFLHTKLQYFRCKFILINHRLNFTSNNDVGGGEHEVLDSQNVTHVFEGFKMVSKNGENHKVRGRKKRVSGSLKLVEAERKVYAYG